MKNYNIKDSFDIRKIITNWYLKLQKNIRLLLSNSTPIIKNFHLYYFLFRKKIYLNFIHISSFLILRLYQYLPPFV